MVQFLLWFNFVQVAKCCLNDVIFFSGNIPPLVRLLQAYIEKASKVIIGTKEEVLVNNTYLNS